jgi:hypothetical protein
MSSLKIIRVCMIAIHTNHVKQQKIAHANTKESTASHE